MKIALALTRNCLAKGILLIAFAFAVFLSPSYAGSVDLPAHGSSEGTTFSISCGDGKALVGVKGKKGMFLGKLQGLCRTLSTEGKWLGSTTYTQTTGGEPGVSSLPTQPFSIACPKDTVVRGIGGRYTQHFIVKINLHCQPLGPGPSPSVISVEAVVATDASVWSSQYCDVGNSTASPVVGKPGRGFHGRFNTAGIRAIGLTCHAGTTPAMEILAAPNGLAAVNLAGANGPPTTGITPFVQLQWMDRSTYESGFRLQITRIDGSSSAVIERPASAGINSQQAVNVTDLPGGGHFLRVCSKFSTNDGGNLCSAPLLAFSVSLASTCSPTITSVQRSGAGTARVFWTHNCTNPANFSIRAQSGNTIFNPIITPNGTARDEDFSFQAGFNSAVRVCAVFPGQGATAFCSAERLFQFN